MNDNEKTGCQFCLSNVCKNRAQAFPKGCPTLDLDEEKINRALDTYLNDDDTRKIFQAAAEIEGKYYCKLTRMEEIAVFAELMGYKRLGVASCFGLSRETVIFAKFLRKRGFEVYDFVCKVGSVDKCAAGIPENHKINGGGSFEPLCNPILQAELLDDKHTELNIIVGLCVGHDTLFIKHSKAPVTYFIVKDRVLGHNPAAAVYTSESYYKKLY